MGTLGHLLVDRFQRGGADMRDHLSLTCTWLGKLLVARRLAKRVQHRGFHRLSLSGARVCPFYDRSEVTEVDFSKTFLFCSASERFYEASTLLN
jgi:hypothetical protein